MIVHTSSVQQNIAQEGGLSHRWHHPAPSERRLIAGGWRRAVLGTALVLGVAAVYALRQTASWWEAGCCGMLQGDFSTGRFW